MNSANQPPFKKRSDPFAASKTLEEIKVVSEEPIKDPFDNTKSKRLLNEAKEITIQEEKPVQQIKKEAPKPKEKEINDENREKYTATMDRALRIRIKKAAIDLGLQVSSFIEAACLEKLERDGK